MLILHAISISVHIVINYRHTTPKRHKTIDENRNRLVRDAHVTTIRKKINIKTNFYGRMIPYLFIDNIILWSLDVCLTRDKYGIDGFVSVTAIEF